MLYAVCGHLAESAKCYANPLTNREKQSSNKKRHQKNRTISPHKHEVEATVM